MLKAGGRALEIAQWALGITSATALLLCLIQIVNSFELIYRPLVHRLTSEQVMTLNFISAEFDDFIFRCALTISLFYFLTHFLKRGRTPEVFVALCAWVAGAFAPSYVLTTVAPVVITIVLAFHHMTKTLNKLLSGLLLCLLTLEVFAVFYWMIYPYASHEMLENTSHLQSGLFYLFGKLNPFLVTLLLFSWLLSAFDHWILRIRGISFGKVGITFNLAPPKPLVRKMENSELSVGSKVFLLLVSLALSWLTVIYAYLPSINKGSRYVSVDAPFYEDYLRNALDLGGVELLRYIFGNVSERSLTIFTMYLLAAPTGLTPELVVKGFPLLLSSLLIISSYFAVVRITYNQRLAVYSALLSGTSVITTVGMYAGYYANWLAISMVLLTIGFAFGYADLRKPSYLLAACVFLTLAELSHVWTWSFYCVVIIALLIRNMLIDGLLRRKGIEADAALSLSLPIAVSLVIDVLKRNLLAIGLSGAELGFGTASSGLSLTNLFMLDKNLSYMLEVFVGGLTSNALYFTLAALAVLLPSMDKKLEMLFSTPLFITSLPFLFYDYVFQSRLLYVIPLNIMTAKGVYNISSIIEDKGLKLESKFFTMLCLLSSVNYALRSSANLV